MQKLVRRDQLNVNTAKPPFLSLRSLSIKLSAKIKPENVKYVLILSRIEVGVVFIFFCYLKLIDWAQHAAMTDCSFMKPVPKVHKAP